MMTQSQFAVVVRSILVGLEPYLSIVAEVSSDSTDIHAARIECPHLTKVVRPCLGSTPNTWTFNFKTVAAGMKLSKNSIVQSARGC